MAIIVSASNDVGVVYKITTHLYFIHPAQQPGCVIACELSTRLRKGDFATLAVGDVVGFVQTSKDTGQIVTVQPRRSQFTRRAAASRRDAHSFEQVIAANVDQVIPVIAAASPPPHWNLLDRYLTAAESADLPAQICITKLDLEEDAREIESVADEYRRIGYPVHLVSALTGMGLDELREVLRGRVSVLIGKSGVGKTSLLNALQPGLGLRVKGVSQSTGKGQHTTSWLELFDLDTGGAVLDTPGVREFGLWDVDPDELAWLFPEMRPWLGQCRFGLDCRHDEEPGCAVRRAVMAGQISPRRYHSYLRLREDGGQ
jgi:ribosome biogenesis GTPase